MKAFANLYALLDETTKTTAKVRLLKDYFANTLAARRSLGSLFSDRPQAATGCAIQQVTNLGSA